MALFGLKLGVDLEMRAAHPHQKNPRSTPPRAFRIFGVIKPGYRFKFCPIYNTPSILSFFKLSAQLL